MLNALIFFSFSLPILVLRIPGSEVKKFYRRNHPLHDAALLTRCYTQHAPCINKEIIFIDLYSIFKNRSVTLSIPFFF